MRLVDEFLAVEGTANELEACRIAVRKQFGSLQGSADAVDLVALAKSKSIEIEWRADLPFEGMLERDVNADARIVLRKGLNRRRERFTLAHELGHWVIQEELHRSRKGASFRGLSSNRKELRDEEYLANLLAAEILLPIEAVQGTLPKMGKLAHLEDICRKYGVSRTMAVRRIADVTNVNLVFLQIVPFLFGESESRAQIDDAIYVSASEGTLIHRESKLVGNYRFADFLGRRSRAIWVSGPKGFVNTVFDLAYRPTPVPHVFALATLEEWPIGAMGESSNLFDLRK